MSEFTRTLSFIFVAVTLVVAGWLLQPPEDVTPEEMQSAKLNKPFFPEFSDPTAPTSIRVVTFNENQASSRVFAVEFKDGLWRIPSHNNYPADGADRLAKTATSLIGVTREEFMVGGETRHDEFGVVDPLESDVTKLKGRGQRVTLSTGGEVLLDLIIGKPVRERSGHRYLRRPDEKSVYVAKISPDLSTKFADWVETNLLKVSRDELSAIEIDNYSLEEGNDGMGKIVAGELVRLTREKSFDPWKLDGLDDPTKEVDSTKSNDLVSTLADLKLNGVRPKPPGLNADLTIDRKIVRQQAQLSMLANEMASKGFVPGPGKTDDDPARLYSKLGETRVSTNKGLRYTLRFGEVFTGSESEIESGAAEDADAKKPAEEDQPKSSRYLLVSVAFDPALLGPKPQEPERPAALDAADNDESATQPVKDKAESSSPPADPCGQEPAVPNVEGEEKNPAPPAPDQPAADDATPKPVAADTETSEPPATPPAGANPQPAQPDPALPEPPKVDPKQVLADLKRDYEAKLSKYRADLADWEGKEKSGQEKAAQLNRRFGEWYYVISDENVTKLRMPRESLIKEKKPGTPDNAGGNGGQPFDLMNGDDPLDGLGSEDMAPKTAPQKEPATPEGTAPVSEEPKPKDEDPQPTEPATPDPQEKDSTPTEPKPTEPAAGEPEPAKPVSEPEEPRPAPPQSVEPPADELQPEVDEQPAAPDLPE